MKRTDGVPIPGEGPAPPSPSCEEEPPYAGAVYLPAAAPVLPLSARAEQDRQGRILPDAAMPIQVMLVQVLLLLLLDLGGAQERSLPPARIGEDGGAPGEGLGWLPCKGPGWSRVA